MLMGSFLQYKLLHTSQYATTKSALMILIFNKEKNSKIKLKLKVNFLLNLI